MSMKRLICLILCFVLGMGCTFLCVGCEKKKELCRYSIEGEYFPEEGKLTATMNFLYINGTETEIPTLAFRLYGNAYREDAVKEPISSLYRAAAYYYGESYGGMSVTSVEGAKSWTIGGEDENVLYVEPESPLFPDERTEILISYTLTLAKVNHRTGITESAVNLGNFYPVLCVWEEGKGYYECAYEPIGDPFYNDFADYSVSLTVPIGYTVVGSVLGTERTVGVKKTWSGSLDCAQDFALALGKGMKTAEKKEGGVTVRYLYSADGEAAATLDTACQSLRYFSETFGEYVYDSLTLVQTGFCFGGMEYPGMVLLSDRLERENYLATVIHETAHQWWYAGVGNNPCDYAWMDEGLAEYSVLLFYENHPSYGKTREDFVCSAQTKYKAYTGIYGKLFGEKVGTMSGNLKDFVSEYEYVSVTYHKGVLLFDALRTGIGDKRFFAGLKEYYSRYLFSIASPEDMIDCFRKTGVDVEGLFRSFTGG